MKRCGFSRHSEVFPDIPRVRPVSSFHKNKTTKDGLDYQCKECRRHKDKKRKAKKRKGPGNSPIQAVLPSHLLPQPKYNIAGRADSPATKAGLAPLKPRLQVAAPPADFPSLTSPTDGMKRCSDSRHAELFPDIPVIRPESCFGKNKSTKDGLSRWCKQCAQHMKKQKKRKK